MRLRRTAKTSQAAGNEGVEINGGEDTLDCSDHDRNLLLVGATNAAGIPTEWSNHGTCVDINVMGDALIISAPSDFLNISAGTSFSTPLLAWYVTQHYGNTDDVKHIMSDLLSKLDIAKALPWDATPIELAWDFSDDKILPVALHGNLRSKGDGPRAAHVCVDNRLTEPPPPKTMTAIATTPNIH